MGIETALIIGAVAAVAGTATSIIGGNQQRAAARHAQDLQEQAAAQQNAQNFQDKANAAREQYRQDRIRRARIMQDASNTGANNSSGEIGALGSLQTQYGANQGDLNGRFNTNQRVGMLQSEANETLMEGQERAAQMGNLGSIFSAAGNIAGAFARGATKASKIPGTTPQPTAGD